MPNKTILVTGGAGFLGSHLCKKLLELGHSVISVDNYYTGKQANLKDIENHPNFTYITHDIQKPIDIKVDEIYNLACPAAPKHYQYDPVSTTKTNILGILNMLELAKKYNAKLMQASTSEVYGDPEVHPQVEEYVGHVNPIGPRACYDEGKRCAETIMFDYHRQYNTRIKVVRIFNTYGPNMSVEDGRVVSNFIVQALQNDPITIYGTGEQTRSFCYADDLINGFIKLMNTSDDVTGPINMGNPVEFTMLELAEKVIKLTGYKGKLTFHDLPADDPTQRKPDITKAKNILGWAPTIKLEDGLKKTIPYFKKLLDDLKTKEVLFLSNTPSPYQVDFFNKLAKSTRVTGVFTQPSIAKNNASWKLETPSWSSTLPNTHYLGKAKALLASIAGKNIKFVIIGGYKLEFSWLVLAWARFNKIPVYYWLEPPQPVGKIKSALRSVAHALILPRASGIFAIDTRAETYYSQYHKDVVRLPYSIDAKRYPAKKTSPTNKPIKFLFVGQFVDRKGIPELISVCKKLTKAEASVSFVGAGPLKNDIDTLCANKKYAHHKSIGFVQPNDLPKTIAEHDVLVFPSKYDGWGVVVAEAMACGLPVISTHDVGAFATLNANKNAGIFCEVTPDSLHKAMQHYIENPTLVNKDGKQAKKAFKASLANAKNAADYILSRIISSSGD